MMLAVLHLRPALVQLVGVVQVDEASPADQVVGREAEDSPGAVVDVGGEAVRVGRDDRDARGRGEEGRVEVALRLQ
jgi:hypothetical protein